MANIRFITDVNQISLNSDWVDSTKFISKDRIVNEKNQVVAADYAGNRYQVVTKKERRYSLLERIGRYSIGCLAVAFTVGYALRSKSICKLFSKDAQAIRFALLCPKMATSTTPKPLDPSPLKTTPTSTPTTTTSEDDDEEDIQYLNNVQPIYGGYSSLESPEELNFAIVTEDGKEKMLAVMSTDVRYKPVYLPYEGTACELLWKLGQQNGSGVSWLGGREYGSPISHFLKHPLNTLVTEKEFVDYILAKDEQGFSRIHSLSDASLLDFIPLADAHGVKIDLYDKDSAGKTLFTSRLDTLQILQFLLERDPAIIKQVKELPESPLVTATLTKQKKGAELLLAAMEACKLPLSQEEEWIKRTLKGDCNFSKGNFNALSQELKTKVYYAANACTQVALIRKLNEFGMKEEPVFKAGPDIIARNMDFDAAGKTIEAYLQDLKRRGQLMFRSEFNKLDRKLYYEKSDQIGRILGTDFIEQIVNENGLKHIKAPKKIAVINDNQQTLTFTIDGRRDIVSKYGANYQEEQLTVYAQRITPVKRTLSLEEARELMIFIEKSGYNDFFGNNIFIAADGIYFIDTEFTNFTPQNPKFGAIESFAQKLDPKDRETFLTECRKRKSAFKQDLQIAKDKYKNLMSAYEGESFTFNSDLQLI